jgi:hypothetical protein
LDELRTLNIATDGAIASSPEKVSSSSSSSGKLLRSTVLSILIHHSLTCHQQRESFWSWRTKLPSAIVQTGPHSIHFDISMPIPKLYQVVYDTREWMNKQGIIGRDVVAV